MHSGMGQSSDKLNKPRRVFRARLPLGHWARWRQPTLRRAFIFERYARRFELQSFPYRCVCHGAKRAFHHIAMGEEGRATRTNNAADMCT